MNLNANHKEVRLGGGDDGIAFFRAGGHEGRESTVKLNKQKKRKPFRARGRKSLLNRQLCLTVRDQILIKCRRPMM